METQADAAPRRARGRRVVLAGAAIAAAGLGVGALVASPSEWASRFFEFVPGWGSFYAYEIAAPPQLTNYTHGGLGVPLRAGQEVFVRWEASAVSGGTVRVALLGPDVECRVEIAAPGAGTFVFRIAAPGVYRLDVHGSATSRTAEGHAFVGAPPPGYEVVYRAKWGPLGGTQRREIAARPPTDVVRDVVCPARVG